MNTELTALDPQIHLVLAEYASIHTDGTATVLRGWINHWTLSGIPALVNPYLLADVPVGVGPDKVRDFSLEIKAPSGLQVALVKGQLSPARGKTAQYAIHLSFQIVEFGSYSVIMDCEGVRGSTTLDVRRQEAQ